MHSQFHNSKRAVRVLNGAGNGWTSAKGAIKLIKQGRSRYVDEGSIEMIADDHRHLSALRAAAASLQRAHVAPIRTAPTPEPVYEYHGPDNLRTFNRYPEADDFERKVA